MADKAFELIFREYNRMITAYLYTLVGNAEEALDLTQETFVVAYRKMKEADTRQSLAAWLRSIAWNTASNALRKNRRQRNLLCEAAKLEPLFESFDRLEPDQVWEARLQALDDCLRKLPDAQSKAVDLFYRASQSCRDISGKLGVLENTVFQILWQARKNLRICIEARAGSAGSRTSASMSI